MENKLPLNYSKETEHKDEISSELPAQIQSEDCPQFHYETVTKEELILEAEANLEPTSQEVTSIEEELPDESPSEYPFRCGKCNKTFATKSPYKLHCQRHLNIESERFLCKPCRKPFGNQSDLTRHEEKVHDPSKKAPVPKPKQDAFRCDKCQKQVKGATLFYKHCKRHRDIESKRYFCKHCLKPFGTAYNLSRHELGMHGMLSSNPERVFMCIYESCFNEYDKEETLEEHLKEHRALIEQTYRCGMCEKCFVTQRALRKHKALKICESIPVVLEQEDGIFKCSTCGKTFSQQYLIDLHIRRHIWRGKFRYDTLEMTKKQTAASVPIAVQSNGEECYKCPLCMKSFRQRTTCVRHIQLHIERAKLTFQCEICELYLSCNEELTKHEADKHGKVKLDPNGPNEIDELGHFKCTECTKTFEQLRSVQEHIRNHKAVKEGKFQCKICGKCLPTNSKLMKHSFEKHNEFQRVKKFDPLEKDANGRFKCTQCELTFANRRLCAMHIRRHETKANKRFQCKKCLKCFSARKNLLSHEKATANMSRSSCFKNQELLKIDIKKLVKLSDQEPEVIEHNGTFICSSCGNIFFKRHLCVVHVKKHIEREREATSAKRVE